MKFSATVMRADQAVAHPVLGHVGDAEVRDACAATARSSVVAVDRRSRPSRRGRRPTIASTSSVWPLPWTPASATISPARTSRLDALDGHVVAVVADVEVLDREHHVPGRRRALDDLELDVAADHQVGERSRGSRPSGSTVPATRPRRSTVIRSATSSTSLSLWVMKMTVVPAAARPRMIPNSSSVSNGRQDGGRLVEHEDVALAVERLEDLHPLAHADGEVLDLARRG